VDNYEQLQQAELQTPQAVPAAEQAETEVSPAQRLASSVGNQAFAALARQGAGILPDGRAHPDVEQTIARTRGGGQALDASTRETVGGALGDPLHDVRVHTDDTANRLATSVSARAFTTGSDVYFAKGEYNPGSSDGNRLLAHELSHVVQQRGAPTEGPLTVSQPSDALEQEADQASSGIYG
jgi:uncharacterized protein DUF4157